MPKLFATARDGSRVAPGDNASLLALGLFVMQSMSCTTGELMAEVLSVCSLGLPSRLWRPANLSGLGLFVMHSITCTTSEPKAEVLDACSQGVPEVPLETGEPFGPWSICDALHKLYYKGANGRSAGHLLARHRIAPGDRRTFRPWTYL
mgnify:CR=1 FL=1